VGAPANIYAHYDIGNAFYSAWLDPSMTYFLGAVRGRYGPTSPRRKNNKYKRLAEAIDLEPGQTLLEIGCGWGGFAEFCRQLLLAPKSSASPSAGSSAIFRTGGASTRLA